MHKNDWKLGKVVLKVADLENMSAFYQENLGMTVLETDTNIVRLGVKSTKDVLVELVEIEPTAKKELTAGLFHLAVLLPSRQDLGEYLYYLLTKKFPLQGASDHGYSEALYFTDPEGNGIEIFADKPKSEWDIREDGRIEGITIQMDAEGVIGTVKKQFTGLPEGSIIGHVHLTVNELAKTDEFYADILGLGLKSDYMGQAKFFASGNYHHHIGSNIWAGKNLPKPVKDELGMAYYTFVLPNEEEYQELVKRLDANDYPYTVNNDNTIVLEDNSGIEIHLSIER